MADDIDRWREEIQWLRGLARRLVSDRELAEDLVQETALLSVERSAAFEETDRPWRAGVLRRLAFTRWRSATRRKRRELASDPRAGDPSPHELLEQVEVHRALTEAVIALDELYRAEIILRYFRALSSAEIA